MKTASFVRCSDCGKQWFGRHENSSIYVSYQCDRCNKIRVEKFLPGKFLHEGKVERCFCGGAFKRVGEEIACPKCGSLNVVSTAEAVLIWD